MNILGISAFYHDSAAALVRDGELVAAAQEERFTRKKHDAGFPAAAMRYCLSEGRVAADGLDAVVFYDKPITKFARLLETYFAVAPAGVRSFMAAMPVWLKKKLWIPMEVEKQVAAAGYRMPNDLLFPEHHESHAASAFYPSPFQSAAILTVDGVGEWGTSSIGHGDGASLQLLKELRFPHSLGLMYSAFTYFTGFKVNSGEYKLMGLAPYGEPRYVALIRDHLLDLQQDGSFRLNMDYFGYLDGLTMTNRKFAALFGGPARDPESPITKREMDLARSVQVVTEDVVLNMARYAKQTTGARCLCLAGGVALNCVANGRLLRERIFEHLWIQPAAGDAGGAVGAAFLAWHKVYGRKRVALRDRDGMKGSYLGPSFPAESIQEYLDAHGYVYHRINDPRERADRIAELIEKQKVVGLFQGRMEFGPRALGNRSIIGDARSPSMQSIMNLKIKYRESFRPFAPSCLEEHAKRYFELDEPSPYMLLVAPVRTERRKPMPEGPEILMKTRINMARSDIPAVTHVDYSARVQTVSADGNPQYHAIIEAFGRRTGYGIIINTSFNVRGEPIVCTPEDAYRCFMRTEMDCLVLESFLLLKGEQPTWEDTRDWRDEFALD